MPTLPDRDRGPERKPFTFEELHDGEIQLPPEIGRGLTMPLTVYQSSRYPWAGVLDAPSMAEIPPRHYFEFRIYRDRFGRTAWRRARELVGVRVARDEDRRPNVAIALLEVIECADRVRAAAGISWFDVLDGEGTNLGEVADVIAAGDYEVALIGGRLFYLQQVHVHPAFRGQHLAARLMAHATWALATDCSDVVVLEARPIECRYTGAEPVRTADNVERLVRYYERVGFRRWKPDAPITGGHVEMYYLGMHRLPFMTDAIDP